ncbi:phage integrase SAM-like domain-containing protein [Acidiphilium acidophilum]|uniref:phage integrase SAM-like domain-containing protein n=1 Tax=Acidiphilium acidophilum TaxID=76588 RepID=UPI002E8E622E|nr:phage integrase SAM-like domain-containing protein [Acidiphilium acidophilum]MEE3504337.1 phage integrase SAM-like domain-containing protein [Acidiphilium acidophilum]
MAKKRKDYRVRVTDIDYGSLGDLIVSMPGIEGERELIFDFSVYDTRRKMAAELAFAFRHHLADKRNPTKVGCYHQLRQWFAFLAEYPKGICQMRDVDDATLRDFIAWLDKKSWKTSTRLECWSQLKRLIAWMRQHRPGLLQAELDIPLRVFSRRNASLKPREPLSRAEMERVLAAALSDINSTWAEFLEGRKLIARAVNGASAEDFDLSTADLNDLGMVLAIIDKNFGGIVPTEKQMLGFWKLSNAISRHGGVKSVTQRLYTTPDTIIPYVIAIGAQTYANPESLRLLPRDCMTEHLLLNGRAVISWSKGRSTRTQRRSFLRDKRFAVPNLIDQLLEMTARLVDLVPAGDRNRLFLVAGIFATRVVGVLPRTALSPVVKRFVKRHELRTDSGKPLRLTLGDLRTTGLSLAHESMGFDILKTQLLANHADPNTTRIYVDNPLARREQENNIGRLQLRFVDLIRDIKGDVISYADNSAGFDTRNATAAGFVCRDPYQGIAEGQRTGKLCTAWLGCFTCPNAVIPIELEMLTRLLATRAGLRNAREHITPDRWHLLYAPKLEILERDILPRFDVDLITDVQSRPLPALPLIE